MTEKAKKPGEMPDEWEVESASSLEFSSLYSARKQYSIDETNFVPIDIYETKELFVVEVEVPGITREDIKVSATDDYLIIEGTKAEKMDNEGKVNFLCMERSFGPFRRTVKIEKNTDKNNIKAVYAGGILFIKLPKRQERRKEIRTITILDEETDDE